MTTATQTIPALTVRQPWAWAIAHAGKDVENRTWSTRYRGRIAIHAGQTRPDADDLDEVGFLALRLNLRLLELPQLAYGAVVAVATLADVTTTSLSRWAEPGCFHWQLTDVHPLAEPLPASGKHRLWPLPPDVAARLGA